MTRKCPESTGTARALVNSRSLGRFALQPRVRKLTLLIPTQALSRQLRFTVKAPPDPGFAALRRAARAAVVIPLAFALADLVLREPQSLIFVVFGCFSLLVISDFGGLRRQRAIAYLTATVMGAVLVALGTLASSSAWLAAVAMLVVGFV